MAMADHSQSVIVDVPLDDAPAPVAATPSKYSTRSGPSTLECFQEMWAKEAAAPQVSAPSEQMAFASELPGLTPEEFETGQGAERIASIKREMALAQAEHDRRMYAERAETRQGKLDAVANAIAAAESRIEEATNKRDQALWNGAHENASWWSGEIARREAQLAELQRNYDDVDEYETARQNTQQQRWPTFSEAVDTIARGDLEREWAHRNQRFLESPGGPQRVEAAYANALARGHLPNSPGLLNDVNTQIFGAPYHEQSRSTPQRVTLDRDQQDVARSLGLTNKQYARELLKLNDLKRQGNYQDG
jgi:hypothetical protein